MDPIALRATTVLVAGIFWKFFLTTALQGYSRFISGGRPPEDQKFGLQGEDVVQGFTVKDDGGGKAAAKMERWNRVVANDLENLPLGLILCILSCMTIQQGSVTAWVHVGCCCAFGLGRVLHTVCFAYGLQPWRTVSYVIGVVASFVWSIMAIINVFQ